MSESARSAVARVLRSARAGAGDALTVVPSPYCSTPTTLLRGLADQAGRERVDQVATGFVLGGAALGDAVREQRLQLSTWHPHGVTRRLVGEGLARYTPLRASEVLAHLDGSVDVALIRVSPPDAQGRCCVGPSGSITVPLVRTARVVLAEVDPEGPRYAGPGATVSWDDIDAVAEAQEPVLWPPTPDPDAAGLAAAARVVELVPSGATLQLGIGTLPEAVGRALARSAHRGLRLVGTASRSAVLMLEAGVVAPVPGAVRAAEILGDTDVVRYFEGHPSFTLHSSTTMHDARWLGTIPTLVSVCTGLLLDTCGNVASERAGSRIISGIGGIVDFLDGARRSPGGLTVIVMTSHGPTGASRLVEALPPDAITAAGSGVDLVVTEHGVADLRGPLDERPERLRAVFAAPGAAPR